MEAGLGSLGAPLAAFARPWRRAPCGSSPSAGPVCTVLPTATLPLRPAAVPETGGAAGPEEPGAGKGHRGAGRARGHSAV